MSDFTFVEGKPVTVELRINGGRPFTLVGETRFSTSSHKPMVMVCGKAPWLNGEKGQLSLYHTLITPKTTEQKLAEKAEKQSKQAVATM